MLCPGYTYISVLSRHLETARNLLVLCAAPCGNKQLSVHITTFNRFFNTCLIRLWVGTLSVNRVCTSRPVLNLVNSGLKEKGDDSFVHRNIRVTVLFSESASCASTINTHTQQLSDTRCSPCTLLYKDILLPKLPTLFQKPLNNSPCLPLYLPTSSYQSARPMTLPFNFSTNYPANIASSATLTTRTSSTAPT